MKRIIPILFGGIITLIILFSACEKVVYQHPEIIPPDSVSYSLDIQPIFTDKCVSCHGGTRNPDLRPDNSFDALISGGYVNTDDPASSVLMNKLYGSHNARANEPEKQLILLWIEEGAKDN